MSTPLLILVTGLPGTGKTTLARKIAAHFSLPFIHKDRIKEVLFNNLCLGDREWSKRLSRASFGLLLSYAEAQLQAGQSLIIEGNFDPKVYATEFLRLKCGFTCEILQIHCITQADRLLERFEQRTQTGERHPGHLDVTLLEELRALLASGESYRLELDSPCIEIDTTDFATIDEEKLFRAIASHLDQGTGTLNQEPSGETQ